MEQWLPEVRGRERERVNGLRSFGEVAHGVAVGFQSKVYYACRLDIVVESPTVFIFNLIKEK